MNRRLVHISMIAFALAIGRLPAWAISFCCLAALLFNWLLLPKLTARSLQRDATVSLDPGLLWYPASLLMVSLLFQNSLIFLVIGWGAMAFGDAAAGILGGGKAIGWNRDKTWRGSLAFLLLGTSFTIAFLFLVPRSLLLGKTMFDWAPIILIAMIAGMLIESVPNLIDDNLSVPLGTSTAAWLTYQVLAKDTPLPVNWHYGLAAITVLMLGAVLSKKIDIPGAMLGGLLTGLLWVGCGWLGIGLIASLFVLGSLASRWSERVTNRAAEQSGDEVEIRGVSNVLANGLVAGLAGLLAWSQPELNLLWTAVAAAALAAATSDTLASELGTLYGKRFVHVIRFTPMQRGEDGAISLKGSLAGVVGAAAVAALFGLGTGAWALAAGVMLAGLFGNWLDSVLGVYVQRRGLLNNHTVNVLCTVGAAALMLGLCELLELGI